MRIAPCQFVMYVRALCCNTRRRCVRNVVASWRVRGCGRVLFVVWVVWLSLVLACCDTARDPTVAIPLACGHARRFAVCAVCGVDCVVLSSGWTVVCARTCVLCVRCLIIRCCGLCPVLAFVVSVNHVLPIPFRASRVFPFRRVLA